MCAVGHVWSSENNMEVALLSYHVDPVRSQTRQMTDVTISKQTWQPGSPNIPLSYLLQGYGWHAPLPNLNLCSCSSSSGPPTYYPAILVTRPFHLPLPSGPLGLALSHTPTPPPMAQLSVVFPVDSPRCPCLWLRSLPPIYNK